ncbi:DUF445 domain-containing protein [Stomatohabitans albus]|uniref:DUF445 domain-containing protein n=1 Tax=Stomatohabitans albus TaxID=3110766 RepID=UPI00300CCE81
MATIVDLTSPKAQARAARLKKTRGFATGLLAAVALTWLILVLFGPENTVTFVLKRTLEAGMVGGLADWFAVTALFRYPMGIPIPHTAIVPRRKDDMADHVGTFSAEAFLSPELLAERVREANGARAVLGWLSDADNATDVVTRLANASAGVVHGLADESVRDRALSRVRDQVLAYDAGPMVGKGLTQLAERGQLEPLIIHGAVALRRLGRRNRDGLIQRIMANGPSWIPSQINQIVAEVLVSQGDDYLRKLSTDDPNGMRADLIVQAGKLGKRLETDRRANKRVAEIKAAVIDHPAVQEAAQAAWPTFITALSEGLRNAHADGTAREVGQILANTARDLREDAVICRELDNAAAEVVRRVVENNAERVVAIVADRIRAWDGEEAATNLESLIGPDLQFIRINGTVVGAMAGLVITLIELAL